MSPLEAKEPSFREPQAAAIPQRTFKITDFGAVGDGTTMNTDAFRAAIAACAKAGGGRVVVPAGTFLTGPIELASRTALVLEKGAVIQASDKFADFGLPDPLPATQSEIDAFRKQLRPFISGHETRRCRHPRRRHHRWRRRELVGEVGQGRGARRRGAKLAKAASRRTRQAREPAPA